MEKVPYKVLNYSIMSVILARDEVYSKDICENQADYIYVAAIDPDVHTLLTWYSPTIGYENFGNKDINHIFS
ncbi:21546_t:CDS:2 [Gigaspora margarita]|uniref:21546_t:CDS:1 n=1 Tax=Gigaspora margarita TaxID=4874 RepID=A0ABM8W0W5_GIGMA|nr:21546_t:CDS:2 [Gigaspora margarita]